MQQGTTPKRRQGRWGAAWGVLWIVVGLLLPAAPLAAAPAREVLSEDALQNCSDLSEEVLQDALNRLSQQIFADQLAEIDLTAVVAQQWVAVGMDRTLQSAVATAVERVQSETGLWDRWLSAWSPDLARQLALAVTSYTFDSLLFREALQELTGAVSAALSNQLALASADSASASLFCMQTFIGARYSVALSRAFEQRIQEATAAVQLEESGETDLLAMLGERGWALGGIGVIVAAQLARRLVNLLAQQLSQRVAGRITGRLLGRVGTTVIPLAGWILGAGMIAYDLYDSREGALPQIQSALLSPEVAAGIQQEYAGAIRQELQRELPDLARRMADDLFVEWRTVKRTIRQVLDLAAEDAVFASLVASLQTQEQLARLVTLVRILQADGGQERLAAAVRDGTLRQGVDLPEAAIELVQQNRSLQDALAWYAIAGSSLEEVVRFELYKLVEPEALDRPQLESLLALQDGAAIARLALLSAAERTTLLQLAAPSLRALAGLLLPEDLAWLAAELPALTLAQRNQLVTRLISQPEAVVVLRRAGSLAQLANQTDLDVGITFLTGAPSPLDYLADSGAVLTGAVSPSLFGAKYGVGFTLAGLLGGGLAFLVVLRLVWGMGRWLLEPLRSLRRGG
ncbi:MAG: hypothetical protein KGS73_09220 [Chloroflexi bacterium]|nr:hypothetical protein [Chloroflexota bacterium]